MAATELWRELPKRVQRLLADPDRERLLSAVSIAEVAIKTRIGKLNMSQERVQTAIFDLKLDVLPFTPAHARKLFDLPMHHREPFDRFLIASAIVEDIPLVGGDAKFPAYKPEGLRVLWK